MVGLVQFVLLVLDDVLPFGLISVVLLVLPHEFIVSLFLLHSFLGQQLYQFFLLLLLLSGYALDGLLNGCDEVLVLLPILFGSLFGLEVVIPRLRVSFEML